MFFAKPNLRIVLFFAFSLLSVIPVLFLGWWTVDTAREREYSAVKDKHLLVAKNLTLALSRYVQDTVSILEHFSAMPLEKENADNNKLLHAQDITTIRVFNKNGEQLLGIAINGASEPAVLTSAQLVAVRAFADTTKTVFLPVQAGSDGEPRILIVSPLVSGETYLVAEMATRYIAQLQSKVKFGELGHAAIVDQAGNVLAHPNPDWVRQIKNIAKVSAVRRMMNRETGVEQFYSPAKKADMIAGFSFVKATGWGVMVPQPVAELEHHVESIEKAVLGVSLLGIAFAMLISWFLAMKLARPTQQLSAWQRAVLDSAGYSIISTDIDGIIATFNRKAEEMLGYSADEMIGKVTPAIIHDPQEIQKRARELTRELGETVAPGFEVFAKKARTGIVDEREWNYVHKDGSKVPVFLAVTALHSASGEVIGFLGIASDLTEHKAMQESLLDTETRYRTLFESAGDAIMLFDNMGDIVDSNPATQKLFRCDSEEIIGSTMLKFSPELQPDESPSSIKAKNKIQAALNGQYQFFEWSYVALEGTPFEAEVSLTPVRIGDQRFVQGMVRDITERKHFEQQLAYQAGHDSLTGLPNRKSLHEAFLKHINTAEKLDQNVFMMLLDLDRFKEINDTLGHLLGDQVLAQVGPRLKNKCGKQHATISRLGGDEFAIVLSTDKHIDEIKILAEIFKAALQIPFQVSGLNVNIGASIGVACYPEHGTDSHQLLRAADVAMYEAKKQSLGVVIYDPSIDEYTTQRLRFANELTSAVQKNQLILHYQPKINIKTGKIIGFEALVRWQHPEEGLLFPDRFIDLVEMSEVIHPFTQNVIEMAVSEKKKLQNKGFRQPLAINLSARNLVDDACFDTLETALAKNDLSTIEIELEITESAVMQDPEGAARLLDKFKDIGINIAIDDFGTGYSSLSHLRQLPLNALKIDRSFVMHMLNNTQDSAIVRSTIALAHSLDMKVIAEGVEDRETLELLRKMDCDEAQGYGICRPQPFEKLVEWISANESIS